jgi:hypothetical protein
MAVGRDITERLQIIAEGFEQSGRSHAAATCDEAVAEILRLRHGIFYRPRRRSRAEKRDFAHELADMFGVGGLFKEPRARRADAKPDRPSDPAIRADPRFDVRPDA